MQVIKKSFIINKKADENILEKLYMFSQTRSRSAIVTKRYNDSEKQALTEQFKVNIFVFEAIAGAARERARKKFYI